MFNIAKAIFGTKNARVMKAMQPIVEKIGCSKRSQGQVGHAVYRP
jgi:hypothetical protein